MHPRSPLFAGLRHLQAALEEEAEEAITAAEARAQKAAKAATQAQARAAQSALSAGEYQVTRNGAQGGGIYI